MTPDHPLSVVADDTPRAATLTDTQATISLAERDATLLVSAVAAVLNGAHTLALTADDRGRLRRVNLLLFQSLSARGQREVRERTSALREAALKSA
jgi:hypothetical protein